MKKGTRVAAGEPSDQDGAVVELELHTPEVHKLFTSRIEGTTLINNTAKKGQKGRTTQKEYRTLAAARKAQDRAVRKKVKEGYFPLDPDAPLPLPFDPDASGIERGPLPKVIAMPRGRNDELPAIRNCCPPQLEQYQERYGYSYTDGPGTSCLWWQPAREGEVVLHLGRRHFIDKVEPELRGVRFDDFRFDLDGYPFRPDGEALLVACGEKLYEVEVATATATERYAFEDAAALEQSRPFLYDHSGTRVLHGQLKNVVALDLVSGERTPVIELEGEELVQDMALLAEGKLAVLQKSLLSIFSARDDGAWTRTHAMICRGARRIDTMLGGKIMAVLSAPSGDRRTMVLFGVKDGQLYELSDSPRVYRRAFDYRGAQWLVESAPGGDVDWTKYRVYNLEITHAERTAEREPVPADHPINTPCLHDLLAAPLSDVEVVRKKIRAQVERLPQTLELGQPRSDDISAPAHWQTPLYYAAVRAPVELVKLLLDLGAEVDAFSSRGVTPLVGAILQRRFDVVELLLEHGASLDVPNVVVVDDQEVKTYPPIVAAARVGEKELVLRALEAGASIDARGRSADQDDESKRERLYTPLTAAITGAGPSWAVNQPHGELVELLLERGASLNLTAECLSPLEAAEFSAELVQRLIDAGAEAKGPVNSTLLLAALGERDGHDSIPDAEKAVALISAGARTDAPNALALACKLKTRCEYFERPYTGEMGLTIVNALLDAGADPNYAWHTMPLCFAAAYPQPDFAIVEALLEGGAEIDQRDGKRITPLRYAIGQNEDDRLANMLLDRGASIERGDGHWSPLHDAVWVGKLAIAARLLERGASVEETTSDGRTPINVAAWNDQVEAIRWLLERGADPDGGETGWSALMAAARKNNVEAVKLLLDAGADPERKGTLPWDENDKTRRTAQEHAEAEGAGAAADALGKRTGKAFASLHRAVEADDLGEVQRLLAEGAKADRADGEHQRRPAHLARSAPVLAALLDAGAKVDGPDKHGNTPLMLAAQGGHPGALAMVQLLIERGADLNKRARGSQQTPLTAAAGGGELDIVEGLLEAGAKVRCKDYSPLHAAAAKGRVEVIKRLLDAGAEVDAWSHDGVGKRTPLGEAACCGHLEAARLLLAAGASSSKRDDTPGDDEDEDYWCYAGYNAVSHAASQGNYDVLKLLLAEGDGGVFDETADHSYPEDLAEGHPRCQALIRAWIDGKSPEEFEADEQAAQAAAAEARASAEAGDDLYLQKVEAPFVHHGDRSLPGKVKLKYGDWSVLFPSGYAFCLIHSMGKYEVRVADVEGVHELPEQLVQPSFTYCQSPDATRMLLVAGQRLIEINLATRAMRDLYTAERKIDCAGYARDAVYALDSEGLCYMPYGEGEGALKPAWTLPRGEEVETLESTGGALICIVTKSNTRRVVFATLDGEGMRHHARVELENPLTRVWFHRGPDDEQQRVFAMDSWSDTDATFYELHNVGITGRGELAEQVLAKPIVDDLPLTPVVD